MTKGESPLLAGPVSECCVQRVKHSGEATGKSIDIDGIPTYLAEPPSEPTGKKQIVLFFSDVFGPLSLNNQLIQDYFASNGWSLLRRNVSRFVVRLTSRLLCARDRLFLWRCCREVHWNARL